MAGDGDIVGRPAHMIALVDLIETVNYDQGYEQPGEPFWRIEIGGYVADFDYPEAANNFANAINEATLAATRTERDEAVAREREECAHAATSFLVGDPANGVPLRNPMPHEIAEAIRARRDEER